MGFFSTLANATYAARLHNAYARMKGIAPSQIDEAMKRILDMEASSLRAAGVSPEQAARWMVED